MKPDAKVELQTKTPVTACPNAGTVKQGFLQKGQKLEEMRYALNWLGSKARDKCKNFALSLTREHSFHLTDC